MRGAVEETKQTIAEFQRDKRAERTNETHHRARMRF